MGWVAVCVGCEVELSALAGFSAARRERDASFPSLLPCLTMGVGPRESDYIGDWMEIHPFGAVTVVSLCVFYLYFSPFFFFLSLFLFSFLFFFSPFRVTNLLVAVSVVGFTRC